MPLRFDGIGPVKIGMTEEVIRSVLTDSLISDEGLIPGSTCYYISVESHPVAFMMLDGALSRIDVTSGRAAIPPVWKTEAGAQIGDSESRIKELYPGRVTTRQHVYVENGHYLEILPTDPALDEYLMLFETDGEKVTRFRAGLHDPTRWIEGCL